MVISFTPEQEARLAEVAREGGLSPEAFVAEAALGQLEDDAFDTEVIRQRLRQAECATFIEADEMDRRFQKIIQPR